MLVLTLHEGKGASVYVRDALIRVEARRGEDGRLHMAFRSPPEATIERDPADRRPNAVLTIFGLQARFILFERKYGQIRVGIEAPMDFKAVGDYIETARAKRLAQDP